MSYFFLISFFIILITGYSFFKIYVKGINVFFIFSLFASIYYLGIPIELMLFNTSFVNQGMVLSQNHIESIILMSILSIVGFGLGYYLSGYHLMPVNIRKGAVEFKTIRSIYILIISVIVVILTSFSEDLRSSFSSYQGNVITTYTNSGYAYSKDILFFSVSIAIAFLSNKKNQNKIFALVLTSLLVGFGVFSSDKDPILMAVIAWGVYFMRIIIEFNINKVRVYIVFFLISFILIPLSAAYFSYYRNGNLLRIEVVGEKGLYRLFDSVGPMNSLIAVLDENELDYKWGATYSSGFVSWIPKSLWDERPMDLSEEFAKREIKKWYPGRGMGFSPLAEAYINFGIIGSFIQYLMIGLMLGGFGFLTRWIFKQKHTFNADLIYFIWLIYTLAIMHRGPFNIPSAYIRFILPIMVYFFIFDYNEWIVRLWKKIIKK